MKDAAAELDVRCERVQSALGAVAPGEILDSPLRESAVLIAAEARKAGRADLAILILERLVVHIQDEPALWQQLGFSYGEEQRLPDAQAAFRQAAQLKPEDPLIAFAHAQASLDAGHAAQALFARAQRLAPENLAAVDGRAAALSAQGEPHEAEKVLAAALVQHPGWLQGHKSLIALRWTSGHPRDFARSYASACRAEPRNQALRLAWFGALAQARDWAGAEAVIEEAETDLGASPAIAVAHAYLASESGNVALADEWFTRTASIQDEFLGIAHLRHCLRTQNLSKAESLAMTLLRGRSARAVWPYLSIIWRLRGDARAQWLDGAPPYIRTYDDMVTPRELDELAATLRRLHTARNAHLEQSVRGGTQTDADRQLFFRAEPEIQVLKSRVRTAIRDYVAGMPAPDLSHPLLGTPRNRGAFSGSWSVRLTGQGHHVSHTHPKGWISSSLYVSLPSAAKLGPPPAGWIRFGAPPSTLGATLPAYAQIEPRPGRLVLFPSTMWHETLPFDAGERLVIAFDVIAAGPRHPT